MKKFRKFVFSCLAIVMLMGIFFANPIAWTFASPADARSFKITITNLTDYVALNHDLKIPKPEISAADGGTFEEIKDITARLTTPNNKTKIYNWDDAADNTYFDDGAEGYLIVDSDDLVSGEYYLVYTAYVDYEHNPKNFTISSETYKITVESESYTIDFAPKSKTLSTKILPKKTNFDFPIYLPDARILDSEGKVVEGAVASVVVKKAEEFITIEENTDGEKFFEPKINDTYMNGTYIVVYTYKNVTKEFMISVDEDFDPSAISLKMSLSGFPATGELGKTISVPKPSVTDNNASGTELLDVYVTVEVKNVTSPETGVVFDYETYSFKSEAAGESKTFTYDVTYKIEDFFGNTISDVTKTINKVTDKSSPVVSFVEDYDPTDPDFEDNIVVNDRIIATKMGKDNLIFPAIYAKDAATDYTTLQSKFRRELTSPSGTIFVIDQSPHGTTLAGEQAVFNERVKYTFPATTTFEEGEYTLRYSAVDNAESAYTGYSERITIYISAADLTDNKEPVITFNTLNSIMSSDETLTFTKPYAIDYDESYPSEQVDAKPRVYTYYSYADSATFDAITFLDSFENYYKGAEPYFTDDYFLTNFNNLNGFDVYKVNENKNKNTELALTLQDYVNQESIVVYVIAIDDSNNVSMKHQFVEISNINESDAPEVSAHDYIGLPDEHYCQGDTIELPSIAFNDTVDKWVSVFVNVYDRKGQSVTVNHTKGPSYSVTGVCTLEGASFTPTTYGKHTIIYSAKDAAGNITMITRYITIKDGRAPYIEVNSIPTTLEVGETLDLPTGIIKDSEGEIIEGAKPIRTISGPNFTLEYQNTFIPMAEGNLTHTYTITYSYTNSEDIPAADVVFSITYSDTKGPVITLLGTVPTEISNAGALVSLPDFSVGDNYRVDLEKTKLTVKNKFNDEMTVTYDETHKVWQFNPNNHQGNYSVIYSATDINGLTTTKEFIIKIGDLNEPKIIIDEIDTTLPQKAKKDSVYTIDKTKIEVSDINGAGEEIALYMDNLIITISHETDGILTPETEDDDIYSVRLEKAGKYTITFSIKDANNNEKVVKRYITVAEDKKAAKLSKETTGTILIIVSLVILGGVILYFFLTSAHGKSLRRTIQQKIGKSKRKPVKKDKNEKDA